MKWEEDEDLLIKAILEEAERQFDALAGLSAAEVSPEPSTLPQPKPPSVIQR